MKKTKLKSSQTIFKPKMTYGYDCEWACRFGLSYEPRFTEISIYFGPFRFWAGK